MSSQLSRDIVDEPVPVDVPDERVYEAEANADVDRALVNAIEAAEQADNSYLAGLLANELGSHYYDTR